MMRIEEKLPFYCVAWLSDRELVASGGGGESKTGVPNGVISCRLAANSISVSSRYDTGSEISWTLAASPQRRRVLVSSPSLCITLSIEEETLAFRPLAKEKIEGEPEDSKRAAAFDPSGERVAISRFDGSIEIRESSSLQLSGPRTLKGHSAEVSSIRFSPDGQLICSAATDGTLRLWSATNASGVCLATFRNPMQSLVSGLNFKMIRFADSGNAIEILMTGRGKPSYLARLNIPSLETRPDLSEKDASLQSVCSFSRSRNLGNTGIVSFDRTLSDDGVAVFGEVEGDLVAVNASNGSLRRRLKAVHEFVVTDTAISPNNKLIVSVSPDCTLCVTPMPPFAGSIQLAMFLSVIFLIVSIVVSMLQKTIKP